MPRPRPRRRPRRTTATRPRRSGAPGPAAAPAAARLLTLARRLTDLARREPAGAPLLGTLVGVLGDAYAADGPLARELGRAATGAADSPGALDLGWAREQVRLAVAEALARLGPAADMELRAWLVVAACETLAREPGGGAGDRLAAAVRLIASARPAGGAGPGSA